MDIVNESGTGFAFPSQTLYFGRDSGLDPREARRPKIKCVNGRIKATCRFLALRRDN